MSPHDIQSPGTGKHGAITDPFSPKGGTQFSLGRLLRRANRLVQSSAEARFGAADLNFTQWSILHFIGRASPITLHDLTTSMEISSGTLSRVIEGLVARKLLAREYDVDDRRTMRLSVTPAGCAKLDAIMPVAVQRWERLFAGLPPADIARLVALLGKFAHTIERNAATGS